MSDDFNEFACPRCQKEPRRGIFLGAQIWHDECLVEDLVEQFKAGSLSREQVEEKLKKIKNDGITSKVEAGCGWNEPQKSLEEIQAEYEAAVEAAAEEAEANEITSSEGGEGDEGDGGEAGDAQVEQDTPVEQAAPATTAAPAKPAAASAKPKSAPAPATIAGVAAPQPVVMQAPAMSVAAPAVRLAPRDPEVRFMTMSLMRTCMKSIKDIEWARLLFNIIKAFDWPKEEGKSSAIEFGLPIATNPPDAEDPVKDEKKKQLATLFSTSTGKAHK